MSGIADTTSAAHQSYSYNTSFFLSYLHITIEDSIPTLHAGVFSNLTVAGPVESITFYENGMTTIKPGAWNGTWRYLTKLTIQKNNLTKINNETFANLRWLTELWLDHNRISRIEQNVWKNSRRLEKLSLSHNRLECLEASTFYGLLGLRYLYLQHNIIYEIQNRAFLGLFRLDVLNLRNNNLRTLEWNVFSPTVVRSTPGEFLH